MNKLKPVRLKKSSFRLQGAVSGFFRKGRSQKRPVRVRGKSSLREKAAWYWTTKTEGTEKTGLRKQDTDLPCLPCFPWL